MKKEEIESMEYKELVAKAKEIGIEKPNTLKKAVLISEIEKHFGISAQLGRPVNPESERQKRIVELEAKREAGELKKGRPVDPTSARQIKIAEMDAKREAGDLKQGRPTDPTSARQIALAEKQAKIDAGFEVKRGRPAMSEEEKAAKIEAKKQAKAEAVIVPEVVEEVIEPEVEESTEE